MQILNYTPQRHSRFYAGGDRAFWLDAYDWSGIGEWVYTLCMISPSYFVAAAHAPPSGTVRFYLNDDRTSFEDYTIAPGGQRLENGLLRTDCWIGKLTAPVSASVKKYPIYNGPTWVGMEVVAAGIHGDTFGRNRTLAAIGQYTDGIWYGYEAEFNPDEFQFVPGSSGAPSFVLTTDGPAFFGEHQAVNPELTKSLDSVPQNLLTTLAAILAVGGESLTFASVPLEAEPPAPPEPEPDPPSILELSVSFTEFYCDSVNGSNLNGGSGDPASEAAALLTNTNGNWDGASVFICSGAPTLDAAWIDKFASVYLDGATVGVYIARITAVDNGAKTITLDTTAKAGAAPASGATGRTIKVGGAWKGPNAAEDFPFDLASWGNLKGPTGYFPRINLRNNATYSITAGIADGHGAGLHSFVQGYSSVPGDGGQATIDGGTTGASYVLFSASNSAFHPVDLILQNNGDSGTSAGLSTGGGRSIVRRVVAKNVRGNGFVSTAAVMYDGCRAVGCNQAGTVGDGGFDCAISYFSNCVAESNTGFGFSFGTGSGGAALVNCIATGNTLDGFSLASNNATYLLVGCDAYNNGGDGLDCPVNTTIVNVVLRNCNFVKNGGYGANRSGNAPFNGVMLNCGFGTGGNVNVSGDTNNLDGVVVSGSVSYTSPTQPWIDPVNGDFRLAASQARNAGNGQFPAIGSSATVGYPDIGAVQHQEPGRIF